MEESPNSIFDLYYRYQEDSTFSKFEKIDFTPVIDGNKIVYRIIKDTLLNLEEFIMILYI